MPRISPLHAILGTLRYGPEFWRLRRWTRDCKATYDRLRSIEDVTGYTSAYAWRYVLPGIAATIGTLIAESI